MLELVKFIGGLRHSGGDCDGELFNVLPWQVEFLKKAFKSSKPSALSVARGNGKSALCAAIAVAVVDPCGPLTGSRREVVVVASSFAQGRIIFEDALHFLRQRHDLADKKQWRIQDSANAATIECLETYAKLRCVGSDPKRAHGMRPSLALLDEPAQWESGKSESMIAAIRTGMGKMPQSKLIALGTKPASSMHWFSQMLENNQHSAIHAAGESDDPHDRETWLAANPSLPILPSLEKQIAEESELAMRDPAQLQSFKSLRLNMGIGDVLEQNLISLEAWKRCEGDNAKRGGKAVWGLDLGTSAAMSAVAAYWPKTGRLEAVAAFPREPELIERGRRDGVAGLYCQMRDRGELVLNGGHVASVNELLITALERFGMPGRVVCDRWREGELRDGLKAAGIAAGRILRGQGFKDGGEDVRDFRRACLTGKVTAPESLLLRSALSEAICVCDPAGNSKLAKATEGGRRLRAKDDAAAAAILAVAEGARLARRPLRKARWSVAA